MSKRKKPVSDGPSNAYLLSFGDTMTALLAFFIVLNSLAEEQTGANLHSGTGSFVQALESMGLPGTMHGDNSRHVTPLNEPSPLYMVPDDAISEQDGNPDEQSDKTRVRDWEQEQLQRFLNEMDRFYEGGMLPDTKGEIVFDLFDPLNSEPPLLSNGSQKIMAQSLPLLVQSNYHVEVIVWATTPGRKSWMRAVKQSQDIVDEFIRTTGIPRDQQRRIQPVGRAWLFSDAKRPVMSMVVSNRTAPDTFGN